MPVLAALALALVAGTAHGLCEGPSDASAAEGCPDGDGAALLQTASQPRPRGGCSGLGIDPYSSGCYIPCCAGFVKCLSDWESTGRLHYRCEFSCPAPSPSPSPPPSPAPPVPSAYYPYFDMTPDYLNIAAGTRGVKGNAGSVSDNFYLVVSDQGACDGGCKKCCAMQMQVAQLMNDYVQNRKAQNPNSKLLFVLACGDNYYWNGASEGRFNGTWLGIYSRDLTSVPWFGVMGNHDYGDSDPGASCPHVEPRFTCDSSNANTPACGGAKPYSVEMQGYDSNQLNAGKGGVDGSLRDNWHAPDYTYWYSIPELDFELVALDWNAVDIDGLGGNADGHKNVTKNCGSTAALTSSMDIIKDASTKLMSNRSRAAESKNVAIISHYPDEFQGGVNFRDMYLSGLPAEMQSSTTVFNFFGHTHFQQCRGRDSNGGCTDFLTGGSGGCCSTGDVPAGFVAISWSENKEQVVECFTPDQKCTLNAYATKGGWPDEPENVCWETNDDPACPTYDPPDVTPLRSDLPAFIRARRGGVTAKA